MEALITVEPRPGATLHRWQRLLLWLITRGGNVNGIQVDHVNDSTKWIWARVELDPRARQQHLERCLHRSIS